MDLAADCAKLVGKGKPLIFSLDKTSIPGKTVCHFVRFETIVFDDAVLDAAPVTVDRLGPVADLRAALLTHFYMA